MRVHDKAVVLQAIRHGDKQSVVKLYTRSHGVVTVIASASRSATAKIRPSALLPLTLLDVVYSLRPNRDLQRLSEATCYYVHNQVGVSLPKLTIAQFINEVLLKTLREQQPNPRLFDFIEGSLNYLNDADRDYQNLHLHFLRQLSAYMGFEPHNNRAPGDSYFDCREGAFTPMSLPFPLGLNFEDSVLFSEFLKGQALRMPLGQRERALLLDIWIAYFGLHVPGFGEMKSLDVLREISEAMRF